jgi:hypothetical protein
MKMKRIGWTGIGTVGMVTVGVVAGWLVGVPTASALPLPDDPSCMAPCTIDPQTGEMDCPCDGVGNVHTPEPASAVLCGLGALGLALRRRGRAPTR